MPQTDSKAATPTTTTKAATAATPQTIADVGDIKSEFAPPLLTDSETAKPYINSLVKARDYDSVLKYTEHAVHNKKQYNYGYLMSILRVRALCHYYKGEYNKAYKIFIRFTLDLNYRQHNFERFREAHYFCGLIAEQKKLYPKAVFHYLASKKFKDSEDKLTALREQLKLDKKSYLAKQGVLDYQMQSEILANLSSPNPDLHAQTLTDLLNKAIRVDIKHQDFLSAYIHIATQLIINPNSKRAQKQLLGIIGAIGKSDATLLQFIQFFSSNLLKIKPSPLSYLWYSYQQNIQTISFDRLFNYAFIRFFIGIEQYNFALKVADNFIAKNPTHENINDFYLLKIIALIWLKRCDDAITQINQYWKMIDAEKIKDFKEYFADIFFNSGVAAYQAGELTEALDLLNKCLLLNPNHPQANAIRNPSPTPVDSKAIDTADAKNSKSAADDKQAVYDQAVKDFAESNYLAALKHIKRCLTIDPAFPAAIEWLTKNAVNIIKGSTAPETGEILVNLLLKIKKYTIALAVIDQCAIKNPKIANTSEFHRSKGVIYRAAGNLKDACKHFELAYKDNKGDIHIQQLLVSAYLEYVKLEKDLSNLKRIYTNCLKLEPNNAVAKQGLEKVNALIKQKEDAKATPPAAIQLAASMARTKGPLRHPPSLCSKATETDHQELSSGTPDRSPADGNSALSAAAKSPSPSPLGTSASNGQTKQPISPPLKPDAPTEDDEPIASHLDIDRSSGAAAPLPTNTPFG